MEVKTVKSPSGIEAWLVEDFAEPIFALRFGFHGGSAQDPIGKEGLANFVTMMLTHGAGHLEAVKFEQQIDELAAKVEFTLDRDAISGGIEALSEMRDEVAKLVGLALTRPRFDSNSIARVRRRLMSFHGGEARTPFSVAEKQWNAVAFGGHPYARAGSGGEESVGQITAEDLKAYHNRVFARSNLKVVAVGDITDQELGHVLDQLFGDLPAQGDAVDIPIATPVSGGRLRVAEMELPQSVVTFGMGSVAYTSPDYVTAQVVNHIFGASGLYSRLGGELRQKRGLTFNALTWLERRRHGVGLRGTVTACNGKVADALAIMREEMLKMTTGDITQAELDDAKNYLIRSYPVVFGSPSTIAERLLAHAMDGFGPEFFEQRKEMITAVSLDDVKRVARELLDPENLIISIAGTPALQSPRES
jgi:zinc protease